MAPASLPLPMERLIDRMYPNWRTASRRMTSPAAIRKTWPQVIGTRTRIVAVSTHNPLGVTYAAGVYASIFGSSREPVNSHYARDVFHRLKSSPHRAGFKVIVGGSGGWQVCEADQFRRTRHRLRRRWPQRIAGDAGVVREGNPRRVASSLRESDPSAESRRSADPVEETTIGVVEMTTGCGRCCNFCLPDVNQQIAFLKEKIMEAVRVNVREGNDQISLAAEDMFIWGQVGTGTPFYSIARPCSIRSETSSKRPVCATIC